MNPFSEEMIDTQTKSVGVAAVGGPFSLIDQKGKPFSSDKLKKEFSILYFGFTQCPDICPDELDKITEAVHLIRKPQVTQARSLCALIREANWKSYTICLHHFRSRERRPQACQQVAVF